jgi:Rrf2 family transcriptional regulator, cysteine metabolism repressor
MDSIQSNTACDLTNYQAREEKAMWLQVSTKGEYGVRIMVDLARHYSERPRSLTDIAQTEMLPLPYLEQLAKLLREADPPLITSTRGAHGGYKLSRNPTDITMGEILRVLEGPIAPMICATEGEMTQICGFLDSCRIKHLWAKVRDAVAHTIDTMTLADMVGNPGDFLGDPETEQESAGVINRSSTSQFIALSDIRVANSATN